MKLKPRSNGWMTVLKEAQLGFSDPMGGEMPESMEDVYNPELAKNRVARRNKKRPDRTDDEPLSQWGLKGGHGFQPSGQTIRHLPSGLYSVGRDERGFILETTEFPTDELIRFADGLVDEIITQVESFWNRAKKYKEFGFIHKRGILLHGPAGCGKSSIIKMVIEDLIDRDGIILITDSPPWMPGVFRMVREIEKVRPLVNIIEDIDDKMRESENAVALLAMLDGEHQVDNILHIATTNYPERLEERITQRPGRFDWVPKMDLPGPEARRMYLQKFPTFTGKGVEKKLEKWVEDTEGLGIAHLRELVAAVECLGLSYETILNRLVTNKKRAPKRTGDKGVEGFGKEALN